MSNAYWGYWLIILGVFVVVVMLLVQNLTNSNTITNTMVREISEAAMVDSVDYAYYREYGELRINKEKFIETFLRRMAESSDGGTTYDIEFYQIYEAPPKISVKVSSKSSSFNVAGDTETFDIVDTVDAILEGEAIE